MTDFQAIIEIIRARYPGSGEVIPLHAPVMGEIEKAYLAACVDSTFVSSVGAYVTRFEEEIARFCGARHAIATVNGTAALHMALLLAEVRPGDLVLTQSLTFVATANAVAYCGVSPFFLDVDRETLGLDAAPLADYLAEGCRREDGRLLDRKTGRRVAACLPMSTFGLPADLPRIAALCDAYGLPLVEDAAEALGSYRNGRHMGTFGRMGVLSFNGNKVLTTGGGGMILTDDDGLAARARHLTTTAKQPHPWAYVHDQVGYNYRLPNLNAAFGCAQMERLPALLADKRRLAVEYAGALADLGVSFVAEPADCVANYWLCAMLLSGPEERDAFLAEAVAAGVQCRPAWTPLHRLPMYADCPRRPLPVSEEIAGRLVNLPSTPRMKL